MQEKVLSEADVCQIKPAGLKRRDAASRRHKNWKKGKRFSRAGQREKRGALIDTATQQKKRAPGTVTKPLEKWKGRESGKAAAIGRNRRAAGGGRPGKPRIAVLSEMHRRLLVLQDKARAKKKPADLSACGLNPIQGELEETGATISHRNITVLFFVVISDILETYI